MSFLVYNPRVPNTKGKFLAKAKGNQHTLGSTVLPLLYKLMDTPHLIDVCNSGNNKLTLESMLNSLISDTRGKQTVRLVHVTDECVRGLVYEAQEANRLGKPISINFIMEYTGALNDNLSEKLRRLFNNRVVEYSQLYHDGALTICTRPTVFFNPQGAAATHNIHYTNSNGRMVPRFVITTYSSSVLPWVHKVGLRDSVMNFSKSPSTHMIDGSESGCYITFLVDKS